VYGISSSVLFSLYFKYAFHFLSDSSLISLENRDVRLVLDLSVLISLKPTASSAALCILLLKSPNSDRHNSLLLTCCPLYSILLSSDI
jgi:hypothetical protein